MTKRWMWPVIGVVMGLLVLWGLWGEGTASKLFPETGELKAVSSTKPVSSQDDDLSVSKKYDASLHDRGKSLSDPFHGDAITKEKKTKSPAVLPADTVVADRKAEPKAASYPKLIGVISLGTKRRALVEWQGESHSVAEGEQVGLWTVSHIEEKTVVLIGPSGTLTLSTR